MIDSKVLAAILDSLVEPVLFADTDHVTRYMNRAAIEHYSDGGELIGKSLFECHNEESQAMMVEILAAMRDGLDEQIITDDEKWRVFMRAVRGPDGALLGYYERFEPPLESHAVDD
jgi:hypothetical protein